MSKKANIIKKKNAKNIALKLPEISYSVPVQKDSLSLVLHYERIIANKDRTIADQNKIIEEQSCNVKEEHLQNEKQGEAHNSQSAEIEKILRENIELKEKIERLESAKNNNSSNSSIPPSASNPAGSTGNLKPKKSPNKKTSLRKKKQNRRGAPKNHRGGGMKLKETSDNVIDIFDDKCTSCPKREACMLNAKIKDTRYTQDIEIRTIQTEYRRWSMPCKLKEGEPTQGQFPIGVTGSKQYGMNIKMLMVALRNYGIISYSRLVELGKYFGFKFSTSTILNFCRKFADTCISTKELIKNLLHSGTVIGLDETGGNINGNKCWHHSAVNDEATLITSFAKRGKDGTDDAGVVKGFYGTIVHDFWKPYFKFVNVLHAMCSAHLERENNKAFENNPKILWPNRMTEVLHEMQTARKKAIEDGLHSIPEETFNLLIEKYDQIVRDGIEEDPILPNPKFKKNGERRKPVRTKTQNLLRRYEVYQDDILRFTIDFEVPPTNNDCERSMRQIKIAYKVFGCFRTKKGSEDFSLIRSVLDTGRKQGFGPKEIIRCIMEGNPLGIFSVKNQHYLMQLITPPTIP